MADAATKVEGLPEFSRHITTHTADGKAVFETSEAGSRSIQPTWTNFPNSAFGLAYATPTIPADFNANADLDAYYQLLTRHPGITVKGGSVLRVVDMAPGATAPLHRTVSLDYGVVLEGEVELELDSGEKRRLPRGDIFVQRGTTHLWRNPSDSQPTRMLLVHLDSREVVIEGKALPEFMQH
jgi:quercetin dioxygenase-like cupin family protein